MTTLARNIFEDVCNENIIDISIIEKGIEDSYIVETDTRKYIIKIHNNIYYNNVHNFLSGPKLISIVHNNTTIPVPKVRHYGTKYENAFYMMDYREGFHYNVDDYAYDLQLDIMSEIGTYLAQLHNIECKHNRYGWLSYNRTDDELYIDSGYSTFKDLICDGLREFNDSIQEGNKFEDIIDSKHRFSDCYENILEIIDYIDENIVFNSDYRYCHNDFKYDNIIIKENNVSAIIDWDSPMIADPVYNLLSAEQNMIYKYKINNKISEQKREKLRSIFRNSYFIERNEEIKIESNKTELYRLYFTLTFMDNFSHWLKNCDKEEKDRTELFLRKEIDEIQNHFIN